MTLASDAKFEENLIVVWKIKHLKLGLKIGYFVGYFYPK